MSKRSSPGPKVVTKYHVPYLGGYSTDDRVVYIDPRLPKYHIQRGGKRMDVHHYIAIHEEVEKDLIDKFGMSYEAAHHCATAAEKAAVTEDGYDWKQYSDWLKPYIDECETDFDSVPPDLDLTPYRDSKDTQTLNRIKMLRLK